jgi:restriction system protein
MARRKQSPLDELIDATALMPWWVGVILAAVTYYVLHSIASMPNVAPTDAKALGQFAGRQIWIGLSSVFQWILPVGKRPASTVLRLG